MSRLRARRVLPLLALLLLGTTSACGDGTDPDTASDLDPSTETSAALEAITAEGVAGVVRDVVGADLVASYSAAGESDSVGVLARLTGRQALVVTVQIAGDVPIASCDDLADTAMGSGDCVVDEDGTIVASGTAGPFTDDNLRGSTVLAQAVNPETGRVVYALYETYSRQPTMDAATLTAIVTDPALAALTDPATNEAGADIELMAQPN